MPGRQMPYRRTALMVLALPVVFAAFPAIAQDAGTEAEGATVHYGDPIFVSGQGLPPTPANDAYDVTVLDREDLVATGSGRIEDALANIAGFQQFRRSDSRSSNPSAQGVTLRALGGNASSRALVLLDAVPMSDPFFGYIPFSAIAPERLGLARVTRGGGSGPFGAGALAGTIELTTAGYDDLAGVTGQALVNDRGETELSGTLGHKLGSGYVVASGRWDHGRGFFTTPVDQRVPATARARYDSWSAQVRGVAPISGTVEMQANMLVFDDNRTLRFKGADSSSKGQDASLRFVGRGDWAFDVLGYVQARNFTNVVISSSRFTPVLDQRNTPSTGIGGKFELRPPVGASGALRLGADYRRADGELFEDALSAMTGAVTERRNAGGKTDDLGLYAEGDLVAGPLTVTAGARADRYSVSDGFYVARNGAGTVVTDNRYADRDGWEGSFRGGAVFRAGPIVQLRAAAYTGLRLPTLNELYRGFTVFPVRTDANADLRNERLEGYEAGIDLTPAQGVRLSLTAFDNKVKHAIANVTIGTDLRERQNIDAIRARGVELSAGIEQGVFGLNGSLAYTDAEARKAGADFDGFRPAQTPRWVAGVTASVKPAQGWLLSATLRHIGSQFEDDLQSNLMPAATTLDAYAKVPLLRGLSLVLRAENLTDEDVVTRDQDGSIDLGAPRTVWAGIGFDL